MSSTVKILQLGKPPVTVTVEDGSNVTIALEAAGIEAGRSAVRVNNVPASGDTELDDQAVVTLTPPLRAGSN